MKYLSLFSLPLAALLLSCNGQKSEEMTPVLTIEGGQVRGVELESAIVYRGIPYAAPPVGDLRWQLPQPVQPWDSVLVADH